MEKTGLCLWYDGDAEDAVQLYCDTFPDTHVESRQVSQFEWPGGKPGETMTIDFTLLGRKALALNGGPDAPFTNAMSVQVFTDDQAETDRYWNALTADGGEEMMCSWCKDRFGVPWQIVPRILMRGLQHEDPDVVLRTTEAMFTMTKIDHAQIEAAIAGE